MACGFGSRHFFVDRALFSWRVFRANDSTLKPENASVYRPGYRVSSQSGPSFEEFWDAFSEASPLHRCRAEVQSSYRSERPFVPFRRVQEHMRDFHPLALDYHLTTGSRLCRPHEAIGDDADRTSKLVGVRNRQLLSAGQARAGTG